jgi:hypothetical protein
MIKIRIYKNIKKYFVHDVESIFFRILLGVYRMVGIVVGLFLRKEDEMADACFTIYAG